MLDRVRATNTVYLDLYKVSDSVPHDILVSKLGRHEFDKWTTQWTKNWLHGSTQGVVVNGSLSTWRPVPRGVLLGSVLGPALFNIFAGHMDSRIECSLNKFAGDTRLCGAMDTLEGRDTIQRDFDGLESCADTNLMKFNEVKCKVLDVNHGNPRHRLGGEVVESSPVEGDLAVMVDENST